MPEGPEVRTVVDKIRPFLINKEITSLSIGERAKINGTDKLQFPVLITNVKSYGKKIIITLQTQQAIVVSLGMTGKLQYHSGNHSHIKFNISNSFDLFFDDTRYMGKVVILNNDEINNYFKDIGPDLLLAALNKRTWITLSNWIKIFVKPRSNNRLICDALLDQSLVSGIGNYLRSDILYYAGVHPYRTIGSLREEEWDALRIAAHEVIYLSYSYNGLTIQSYISPDGTPGTYPVAVYGKKVDSLGNPVIKEKVKGRSIHWVAEVQV